MNCVCQREEEALVSKIFHVKMTLGRKVSLDLYQKKRIGDLIYKSLGINDHVDANSAVSWLIAS
jgi:hypothetical protein